MGTCEHKNMDECGEFIAHAIAAHTEAAVARAVEAERERAFEIIQRLGMTWHNALPDDRPTLMDGVTQITQALRAGAPAGAEEGANG
jgi:hypothetical protein